MEKKCTSVGGQAIIEGVMMRNGSLVATAVRRPNGDIVYKKLISLRTEKKYLKFLL